MSLHKAISFSLSLIHIVLLFIAHASHGWMMTESLVDGYHAGLWSICSEKFGCKPLRPADVYLNIIRSFMVLATLTSVAAALWAVEWDHIIHCNYFFPPKSLITSIFNFFTGIFVLVAVMVYNFKLNMLSAAVPPSNKWAFYLSCGICVLTFLTVGIVSFSQFFAIRVIEIVLYLRHASANGPATAIMLLAAHRLLIANLFVMTPETKVCLPTQASSSLGDSGTATSSQPNLPHSSH